MSTFEDVAVQITSANQLPDLAAADQSESSIQDKIAPPQNSDK